MGNEISVKITDYVLIFSIYLSKQHKTLFIKDYFHNIYCKVNDIVLNSILWKLLDIAKFVEFYLKMKKEYSANHPSHNSKGGI